MAANNQGIDHIRRPGQPPLCGNRRAHSAITIEDYRTGYGARHCTRCLAKLAKMDAVATRRAARAA